MTLAALTLGACASRSIATRPGAEAGRAGGVIVSREMARDAALSANPAAAHWADAPAVTLDRNFLGEPIGGLPTLVRSRWTRTHLYLLYTCPYDTLYLKPAPAVAAETPKLWNWDVDEAARVWYGEMKIPFDAIDPRGPGKGRTLRIGLYRIAGAAPRTYYAWQPTGERSFHVPEAFGTLRLQ